MKEHSELLHLHGMGENITFEKKIQKSEKYTNFDRKKILNFY